MVDVPRSHAGPSRLACRIDPAARLRDARDVYLRENGFSMETYTQPTFRVPFGRWTLTLPNPRARQRVIAIHDIHHVLTGYGTDLVGECEVAAWEVRSGMGRNWFAWYICLGTSLLGLLRCPARTATAFRAGAGCRSLLNLSALPAALLETTVAEARRRQGIPERGCARAPARLNRDAPDRARRDSGQLDSPIPR